jgi:hypothetical protein
MILGGFGSGHVVQTGGEAHVAGTITLCFWPNSVGTYTLDGGLLSATHIDNRAGGRFYFSAGEFNATTFANSAQLHLSGAGVREVTPVVTNFGSVFATDTEAHFTGTFTNQGSYDSTATDSEFEDLVVTETGYVLADEDSRLFVVGDLLSASTKSLNWDTALAELVFVDSDDDTHTFQQTGNDLGDTYDGYTENFAWAKLGLETGQSLTLGGTGGAVYVGVLDLADGLPQLDSIASNGKNIYYNPLLPENGYLGGTTHSLGGTGEAIPVPEPSMGLLLLAGLPCLAGLAARRRRV